MKPDRNSEMINRSINTMMKQSPQTKKNTMMSVHNSTPFKYWLLYELLQSIQ